eukprot:Pgem_evm1s901
MTSCQVRNRCKRKNELKGLLALEEKRARLLNKCCLNYKRWFLCWVRRKSIRERRN